MLTMMIIGCKFIILSQQPGADFCTSVERANPYNHSQNPLSSPPFSSSPFSLLFLPPLLFLFLILPPSPPLPLLLSLRVPKSDLSLVQIGRSPAAEMQPWLDWRKLA